MFIWDLLLLGSQLWTAGQEPGFLRAGWNAQPPGKSDHIAEANQGLLPHSQLQAKT